MSVCVCVCTHTHNGTSFSYKKNKTLPSVTTWMDLEGMILSETGQRKTNMVQSHLYVESKTKPKPKSKLSP